MDEKKKTDCPLSADDAGDTGFCLLEYCAWYDTENEQCCIMTIAGNLRIIARGTQREI